MAQSNIERLEDLAKRRAHGEERCTEALATAVRLLKLARNEENKARRELERRRENVEKCDSEARRELSASVSIESLNRRSAYRRRLVSDCEGAEVQLNEAATLLQRRIREHDETRQALATQVTKRTAADKMLSTAREEAFRKAEDRVEEELTDLWASRRRGEE